MSTANHLEIILIDNFVSRKTKKRLYIYFAGNFFDKLIGKSSPYKKVAMRNLKNKLLNL
jgi:hypothetical protein